jgi:hypothetical protein
MGISTLDGASIAEILDDGARNVWPGSTRELSAGSGLADKDNGSVVGQVSSAEFDLFERNVSGAGKVYAGELGCGADVNELRWVAGRLPDFPCFDDDDGGVMDDCGCGHE